MCPFKLLLACPCLYKYAILNWRILHVLFGQEYRQYLVLCDDSEEDEVCEEIERLYSCIDKDSSSSSSSSSGKKRKKESKKDPEPEPKEEGKGKKEKKEKGKKAKKVGVLMFCFWTVFFGLVWEDKKGKKNKKVKKEEQAETPEEEKARLEKEEKKVLMKDAKKALVRFFRFGFGGFWILSGHCWYQCKAQDRHRAATEPFSIA